MGRTESALTWDAKRKLFEEAQAPKGANFQPISTASSGRGRPSIPWETHTAVGDLDEYRRNVGQRKAILAVDGYTKDEIKALCSSIKSRFSKVFADESWSVTDDGQHVYLGCQGARKPRKPRAKQASEQ